MNDQEAPPLEALPGVHANVVEIEGFRVRHGRTPYKNEKDLCKYNSLVISQTERRVWCEDCKKDIEPFTVLLRWQREWGRLQADMQRRQDKAEMALDQTLNRRAAKALDKVWSGKMLPCCPHCRTALYPESFESIGCTVSREFDEKRRGRTEHPNGGFKA